MKKIPVFLVTLGILLFFSMPSGAEEIMKSALEDDLDMLAPRITHDVPRQVFSLGQEIEIVAEVTDDSNVEKVTLYYRQEGTQEYLSVEMTKGEGNKYRTTLPSSATQSTSVEYYIEALDTATNFSLRGFSVTPLVILIDNTPIENTVTTEESVTVLDTVTFRDNTTRSQAEVAPALTKPWYKKWWVWGIATGVVLVAASGSGGGTSGAGSPVITTGTITIAGAAP